MRDRIVTIAGCAGGALLAWNTIAILQTPAVSLLIFYYAPLTIAAWLCAAAAMASSVAFLLGRKFQYDSLSVAAIEVGLVLLAGSLAAGTVWERTISGRWWDWNAPLTSALACGLLYVGYLILRHAVEEPSQRATFSAVFSVFVFLDIPAVAYAVERWSRKHPQPPMWTGVTFTPYGCLAGNLLGILLLGAALVATRLRQEESQREVDALRRQVHAF